MQGVEAQYNLGEAKTPLSPAGHQRNWVGGSRGWCGAGTQLLDTDQLESRNWGFS